MLKKTTQLKNMLTSDQLEFIMEAHNGMSARIVEEAGFKGIWASGLTMSASLGVRDNNEASWTQILEILEFMSDASNIPILVDGDTGYGNFNNMRRLVKKLEQRAVAGVCIEDKLFPKTNSFIGGEQQPLADIDEFCGKIKAGKDSQTDDDFCVVARVEAFIAGWSVKEALKRAEAYRQAGADAILIHSKKHSPMDIELFMKEWGDRHPIVIVPTKFYSTPTDRFRDLGISLAIWANHLMRGNITNMQSLCREIYEKESLVSIEDKIAPVSEVFRLQGAAELQEAEKIYLPTRDKSINAVVLAASRGSELEELTKDRPKAMIDINGKPILYRTTKTLQKIGIKETTVVRGYKKEMINDSSCQYIDNDDHENSRDLYSLFLAREKINGESLIAYGDCLYRKHLLVDLLDNESPIRIVVDALRDGGDKKAKDFVCCSEDFTSDFFMKKISLTGVQEGVAENASGEWTGLIACSKEGAGLLVSTLEEMEQKSDIRMLSITDLLSELIKKTEVSIVYTNGGWVDVDEMSDVIEARDFQGNL